MNEKLNPLYTKLSLDLLGGATKAVTEEVVLPVRTFSGDYQAPDPDESGVHIPTRVLYERDNPNPFSLVQRTRVRGEGYAQVGDLMLPSKVCTIQTSETLGVRATMISLYPEFSTILQQFIKKQRPELQQRLNEGFSRVAKALIYIEGGSVAIALTHQDDSGIIWSDSPQASYTGYSENVLYVGPETEQGTEVVFMLHREQVGKSTIVARCGLRVHAPVDVTLQNEILDLPLRNMTYETAAKFVEPFVEIRVIDHFGKVGVYR